MSWFLGCVGAGLCLTGVAMVAANFVDSEDRSSPLARLVHGVSTGVPRAVRRALAAVKLDWLLDAAWNALDWFMNKRHPLIQLLYVGIVAGAFGLAVVHIYPHLHDRNPYLPHAEVHKRIAETLVAAAALFFCLASFTDPGVVHRGPIADAYQKLYRPDPHGLLYPAKDCETCELARPARGKHCRTCDVCVARFDHHCIWLNNCVGERNYRWFLAYLFSNVALMAYGAWAAVATLLHKVDTEELWSAKFYWGGPSSTPVPASPGIILQYLLAKMPQVFFVGALCAVMGAVVGAFTGYHLYLTALNTTTNETFKWRVLQGWHDSAHHQHAAAAAAAAASGKPAPPPPMAMPANPYNRGVLANFGEVFFPAGLYGRRAHEPEGAQLPAPRLVGHEPPRKPRAARAAQAADSASTAAAVSEDSESAVAPAASGASKKSGSSSKKRR